MWNTTWLWILWQALTGIAAPGQDPQPPCTVLLGSFQLSCTDGTAVNFTDTNSKLIAKSGILGSDIKGLPPPDSTTFLVHTNACTIYDWPIYPFDTLNTFVPYGSRKKYHCPPPTFADGIKRVNATWVKIPPGDQQLTSTWWFSLTRSTPSCSAQELVKTPFEAYSYSVGKEWKNLKPGELMEFPDVENLLVRCGDYDKIVPLVPVRSPLSWPDVKGEERVKNPHPFNVLVLGLDSLSRLQYLRALNETTHFMNSNGFQPFYGHHKIGINTIPNVFAMMLGMAEVEYSKLRSPAGKLDALPFIMKEYSNAGYLTTYQEDFLPYGLFTYGSNTGFVGRYPTNYHTRPMNLYIQNVYYQRQKKEDCYGDQLEMEYYFAYLLDQISAFQSRNQSYLSWSHIANFVHEGWNDAQYLDFPYLQLLSAIFKAGHQKNTVIIAYSDHANRRDLSWIDLDSSYLETRAPALFIYIPDGLKLKNEDGEVVDAAAIREVMKFNSHQLTSQFDIYSTLKHLLYGASITHHRGTSLLTPISPERTCTQAGIPLEWCLCNPLIPYSNVTITTLLASSIIAAINLKLEPYTQNCTRLQLDQVVSAKRYQLVATTSSSDHQLLLSLLIKVKPSDALFETTVQTIIKKDGTVADITIISKIDRKDKYREQSRCVAGTAVESFCYCRNL